MQSRPTRHQADDAEPTEPRSPALPAPAASAEQRAGYLAALAFDLADAGIRDRPPLEKRALRRAREQRRNRQAGR